MGIIKVIGVCVVINIRNIKTYQGKGVYIGRGSVFGNPYRIGVDGNREEVIELYRRYLFNSVKAESELYQAVMGLCDKLTRDGQLNLICHCAPLRCHGEVLRNCINWLIGRV
jgi:hypothetical protein